MPECVEKNGFKKSIQKINNLKVNHIILIINLIVFDTNVNDSIAYKTKFPDFRNEKGRDKSLDTSPLTFTISNFKTGIARAAEAEEKMLNLVLKEKYTKDEEESNQVMRPVAKSRNSIQPF